MRKARSEPTQRRNKRNSAGAMSALRCVGPAAPRVDVSCRSDLRLGGAAGALSPPSRLAEKRQPPQTVHVTSRRVEGRRADKAWTRSSYAPRQAALAQALAAEGVAVSPAAAAWVMPLGRAQAASKAPRPPVHVPVRPTAPPGAVSGPWACGASGRRGRLVWWGSRGAAAPAAAAAHDVGPGAQTPPRRCGLRGLKL